MKRAIGIDISRSQVSLVQLCCTRGRYFLEKTYIQNTSDSVSGEKISPEEIKSIIDDAIAKEGFCTRVPVVISIPYGRVFFQNYKTDFSSNKDIKQLLKFELEDDFPIVYDDLVTDIYSSRESNAHNTEFLVGAVSRSNLQNWIKEISETGMNCAIVTAEVCALHTVTMLNQNLSRSKSSIIIYVDNCRTIVEVCEKNLPVYVRHIDNIEKSEIGSTLKREIALTLKAISYNDEISKSSNIILSGSYEIINNLSGELSTEFNTEVIISDPFAKTNVLPQQKDDDKLIIALGLALAGMGNKNNMLNFLAVDKAKADQTKKTKYNAVVFAVLLLVFAALFLMNFFTRLKTLENENHSLEQEIREVFVQTLPDEKRIVNELAQMNEKYNALEKEYNVIASEILSRTSTLKILQSISESIDPDQNIDISGISMNSEKVQLSGSSADFEAIDNAVEKFKNISMFKAIDIGNVDVDQINNKVRFNLSIEIDGN